MAILTVRKVYLSYISITIVTCDVKMTLFTKSKTKLLAMINPNYYDYSNHFLQLLLSIGYTIPKSIIFDNL